MGNNKVPEFSSSIETEKREREIQVLINVIEPDPEYQPYFISDEATFYDVVGSDEMLIEARLKYYFKGELLAPLKTPLWEYVDVIKARYPEWPEEWPGEN